MEKEKFNTKRLLITIGFVLTAAVAVGGATWWAMDRDCKLDDTEETKTTTTVPANFTKITVNGVEVNVPTSWGKLEVIDTIEDFSADVGPGATYKGAVARSDGWPSITVSDLSSMRNVAATDKDMKPYIDSQLNLLEETYNSQSLNPELFSQVEPSMLMHINALVKPFNPRYIENDNGTWRGFWFVSNTGQDMTADVYVMAVMYNKDAGKVLDMVMIKETDTTKNLVNKINKINDEDNIFENDTVQIQKEIDKYLSGAYMTDKVVRDFVNNEFLIVLKTL